MISDVLSDMRYALDAYLDDSASEDTYPPGPLRDRIVRLRQEIRDVTTILDVGLEPDFISPFIQTERPAAERWEPLSTRLMAPTVEAYVEERINSDTEWTDAERDQLLADLAELRAA